MLNLHLTGWVSYSPLLEPLNEKKSAHISQRQSTIKLKAWNLFENMNFDSKQSWTLTNHWGPLASGNRNPPLSKFKSGMNKRRWNGFATRRDTFCIWAFVTWKSGEEKNEDSSESLLMTSMKKRLLLYSSFGNIKPVINSQVFARP